MNQVVNGVMSLHDVRKTGSTGPEPLEKGVSAESGAHRGEARPSQSPSPAFLLQSLISISKATRALMGLKLGEIGLANGQDELLLLLDEDTPQQVTTLADRLGVRPSTVSKTLERIVQRGLARREPSKVDTRMTLVTITPRGAAERDRLVLLRDELEAALTDKMSLNDLDHLAATLQGLEGLLKKRLSRLR